MLVRLQKYLADHGCASRRKCEEYIRRGFIKVNGEIVQKMGVKIDTEKDRVEIPKHLLFRHQRFVYYALHKPVGYVCTVSGSEGPKITELLKHIQERIFPVGRLDKLTSGLLLVTNDGRFAYELTHPKFEKEKEYVVKVREKVTPGALAALHERFFIKGRKTEPVKISLQSAHLLRITLKEGRNRQIRRICQRAELHIEKLKRVRIGGLLLGNIPIGATKKLTPAELKRLQAK